MPTSATGSQAQGALDEDLAQLCAKLHQLRACAASLGLFTNDRELLVCTSCGLHEDVTIEGMLITHDCESLDVSDSGLRFTELQDGNFSCPRCGANIVAGDDKALTELLPHGEEQVAEGKVTLVSEVVERLSQRK
jgi:transcription elongation factor Elf1